MYICFTQRAHSTDYWSFKRDNWEEDSKQYKYLLEVKNVIRFLRFTIKKDNSVGFRTLFYSGKKKIKAAITYFRMGQREVGRKDF